MEVKIIDDKKNRLVFDIEGETHTLALPLKKELWNDEAVKAAGYNIAHPLINIPRVVVETSGKEPRKAVMDAVKRLQKTVEKLKEGAKEIK